MEFHCCANHHHATSDSDAAANALATPIGEDCQTHGVQTCQRRRKNMAVIERREPVRQRSLRASDCKTEIEVTEMPAHHAA